MLLTDSQVDSKLTRLLIFNLPNSKSVYHDEALLVSTPLLAHIPLVGFDTYIATQSHIPSGSAIAIGPSTGSATYVGTGKRMHC